MWADNETNEDLLGYQVHADLLKEVVLDSTMLPITIGIFGDWGSGKNSLRCSKKYANVRHGLASIMHCLSS